MVNPDYATVISGVLVYLKSKAPNLYVDESNIYESAGLVDLNQATPFVAIIITPRESWGTNQKGNMISTMLDIEFIVGAPASENSGDGIRAAMVIAGRILTLVDAFTNFRVTPNITTPFEFVGTYSDRVMIKLNMETEFDPYIAAPAPVIEPL